MKAKLYLMETRPQFLILSVVLGITGTCIAWYDGFFNLGQALLATLGLILTHMSVNTLNDYFDYRSGIDKVTIRTPFSGGSGMIKEGLVSEKEVLWIGVITLALAALIGLYFILTKGWLLLPLIIVAAACVVLYSPLIQKFYWPEWSPFLGLGVLPVLGMYFSQTGMYTWHAVIAAMPSGFLVHNLLLINEFPDIEADKVAHRKTLPITMGGRGAAIVYTVFTLMVYVWVIGAVIFKAMPIFTLLALLTLPIAVKAIRGSFHYDDRAILVPALASNVMVVMLTQLLISVGYILSGVFKI
ncbi:MAG: prenyltransferase [Dehalococcoidia bacterium]